jgi:hypothetical protein
MSIGVVASRLKIAVDLEGSNGWIGARATKINGFWFDCNGILSHYNLSKYRIDL